MSTAEPPRPSSRPRTGRWRQPLLALLVACLAVAAALLPWVWGLLDRLEQGPRIPWLQGLLQSAPALSWLLMVLWGTAVSAALVAVFSMRRGWKGALLVASLTLWAVVWYLHMPSIGQCHAFYGPGTLCNVWEWVFTLSLALATALYLFVVFVLGLSALGLAFTSDDEPPADA